MHRRLVLRLVTAVLATAAMVGGPIAAANASDTTIKLAILHASPGLRHSQARLRRTLREYRVTRRAAPVIRAIGLQDRDLSALIRSVRRSSASSSSGSTARREIITGLGLVLRSNREVARDLRRQGPYGLTPGQLRGAQRLARRGDLLYRRGVLLLART